MAVKEGERVGAILEADAESVHLLGYGVYVGREIPDDYPIENPKIVLDSGHIVWGYQCWWGTEDKVKAMIGSRRVIQVEFSQ